MRIIIAGCRYFNDYGRLKLEFVQTVQEWRKEYNFDSLTIISGGAKGTDALGEKLAKNYFLPLEVYQADWSLGPKAGPIRNGIMASKATHLIAFPSKSSTGTRDMIRQATQKGLIIKIIEI
jgi:hypothetical protein